MLSDTSYFCHCSIINVPQIRIKMFVLMLNYFKLHRILKFVSLIVCVVLVGNKLSIFMVLSHLNRILRIWFDSYITHDDVIKWKHFQHYWPFVLGHRWIPLTMASDAEFWCFLWSASEQMVEQTLQTPVASFTEEINPQLAKRPLKINGRLANRRSTSLVKEATEIWDAITLIMMSL